MRLVCFLSVLFFVLEGGGLFPWPWSLALAREEMIFMARETNNFNTQFLIEEILGEVMSLKSVGSPDEFYPSQPR
jgi:hypothetical protein